MIFFFFQKKMNDFLLLLLLSIVYVSLDLVNFKLVANQLYASFYKDGVTNYYAAAVIYLLYPVAVVALTKASNTRDTLIKAVILGTTGYGLYHLTNMATMRTWPWDIALYDTLWGAGVTTVLAWIYAKMKNL